jgi:molecular chaperone IbpA
MRAFDPSLFARTAIGFEPFLQLVDRLEAAGSESFPPYNILKTGADAYAIEIAVAGFKVEDIEIVNERNALVIRGNRKAATEQTYLHRGIAARAFERRFHLADHVRVDGADLADGVLSVRLVREVPEAMRPRRIEIAAGRPQIAAQAA